MTSIEEVIARSRQPGGFSEHRRFTVARDRAIEKLRQFALADPHYYILELIQAAVANDANYIDIRMNASQVMFSYVGGHYLKVELEQLFDFLFASRANVEQGSLRLLALGVNALMLFEPDQIMLESGDGTLEGTTRIVVRGRDGVVELGTPERALQGTFLAATGLKRGKVEGRSALQQVGGRPREYAAIEERCIVAPVPVIVNGEPIFGYSSQRSPKLFGYSRSVSFDEGDFYGTIGIASRPSGAVFRLVTHGVWVQTVTHDFADLDTGFGNALLGGVISFDHFRKTADHGGIVRDEIYVQMWQRLLPYMEQLRFGAQGQRLADIRQADGSMAKPGQVIGNLRESPGVVLSRVNPSSDEGRRQAAWEYACQVGELLGWPVMQVNEAQEHFVRSVAGEAKQIVVPNVDVPQELAFYGRPVERLPPRPWLMEPVTCPSVTMDEVNAWIDTYELGGQFLGGSSRTLREQALGGSRPIKTTLFTLADPVPGEGEGQETTGSLASFQTRDALVVQVRVCERLVREFRMEAVFPGQVLVIDIPDVQPHRLLQVIVKGEPEAVVLIAQAIVQMMTPTLEAQGRVALQEVALTDVQPNRLAARRILAGLAHATIMRLSSADEHRASTSITLLDRGMDPAMLDLPVLETLAGAPVSVRGLARMMQEGAGLVYGVIPEVEADLEGLDLHRILQLDAYLERLVIELVGVAAYVRIDSRDVLAEYRGVVCRDIALGLHGYADFPLLVEGVDPTQWPLAEQQACVLALVKQLTAQVNATHGSVPQENRRQALRHLQWFAVHGQGWQTPTSDALVEDLPLFLTSQGKGASCTQIRQVQQGAGVLRMFDGIARDITASGYASGRNGAHAQVGDDLDLAMNPYVFWLLAQHGPIVGLTDHGLREVAAEGMDLDGSAGTYLDQIELQDEVFEGVLELPFLEDEQGAHAPSLGRSSVLVVAADRSRVFVIEDTFLAYGVVGVVKLKSQKVDPDLVRVMILDRAVALLVRQVERLVRGQLVEGEAYEQAVMRLLHFAGQHLQFVRRADGMVEVRISDALAQRVFDLPLFKARRGNPLSARRVFYEFRAALLTRSETDFETLQWLDALVAVEELSADLRAWLQALLVPERVHCPAERGRARRELVAPPQLPVPSSGEQAGAELVVEAGAMQSASGRAAVLEATLMHWLSTLRPDLETWEGVRRSDSMIVISIREHQQMRHRRLIGREEILLMLEKFGQPIFRRENEESKVQTEGMMIWLNPQHWLVRWVLATGPSEARPLAWLLLAIYAEMNETLAAVRNVDERAFQQRIFEALTTERLQWVG